MKNSKLFTKFLASVCLVMAIMLGNSIGQSQTPANQQQEEERDIIRRLAKVAPNKIAKARSKSSTAKSPNSKSSTPPDYTLVGSTTNANLAIEGINIGFTFWLLKDAKVEDDPEVAEATTRRTKVKRGSSIKEKVENVKVVPRRVNSNTQFANGDWLRFSLDLPIDGYIYIFNREKYVDGSLGQPYLIFPGQVDKGKSDKTIPGKLLFIPSEPDYFEIEDTNESEKEKLAEIYYVLISPTPLADVTLLKTDEPEPISLELFKQYEKFSAPLLKFESQSEANKTITRIEKLANTKGTETLTEDDPLPQTVYHIAKPLGETIFFSISAEIKK